MLCLHFATYMREGTLPRFSAGCGLWLMLWLDFQDLLAGFGRQAPAASSTGWLVIWGFPVLLLQSLPFASIHPRPWRTGDKSTKWAGQTFVQLFQLLQRRPSIHNLHLEMNLENKEGRVHWNSHFSSAQTKVQLATAWCEQKKATFL